MTIEENKDQRKNSAGLNHLVSAYNRFAFRLFAEVISVSAEGENIFFSPFSIATDLAMLYNSESDEIRRRVADILGYEGIRKDDFNQMNAGLKSLLNEESYSDRLKSKIRTSVNNFCSRDEDISDPEFEETSRKFYDTDFEYLSDDPYGDTATINGWVSGKTKYLSAILSDIHPDAVFFILNTLFFKRDWRWAADFFRTETGIFSLSQEKETEPLFFSPIHPIPVPYYHGKDFQGVSLPYKDDRKRIYFLLPEHLTDFLRHRMNYENWQKWLPEFSVKNGEIYLPNIRIECETSLENLFNMPDIHIWHRGFFKMSPLSQDVSEDRTVTESAAPEFQINFNSPFLCIIQDEETGLILFIGCMKKPSSVKKVCDKSAVCISDESDYVEIELDLNSDRHISDSPSEDADELDLDVDDIIKAGGISVDSELPEHISEELMSSIEAEIDNNLRELYEVYKNGETEPSDCIAGACTCIAIGNRKIKETASDETGLDDINLDGLELDLPNLYNEDKISDYKEKDNPFTYLIKRHLLSPKDLKAAAESRQPVEKYIAEHFKIPRKDILASFGAHYRVRAIGYERNITLDPGFAKLAQSGSAWVPLFRAEGKIVVATDEPNNEQVIHAVKAAFPDEKIEFRVAFREDVFKFIRHFRYIEDGRIFGGATDESESGFNTNEAKKELKIGLKEWELPVTRDILQLVSQIIWDAYFQNVTDIYIALHSENQGVAVQGRIDGICRDYPFFIPRIFGYPIINCIKRMANLNIAERGISQNGKIRLRTDAENVILRAVTYPTHEGAEDAVLTFFKPPEPVPVHEMGFSKRDCQAFLDNITQPYGLVLIAGHDSLSTFHAALNHLNRPERKIFTAEYPVEFIHQGIRQLRLNPDIGFDTPAAIQTILQANPDVIGVNMGRWDNRILQGSIEAALGGYLVLLKSDSFLNASSVIARIIETGTDLFAFTDSLLSLVSQNIIRNLCSHCKESYTPTKKEFDELVSSYGRDDFKKEPPEDINGNPAVYSKDLVLFRARSGGCPVCFGTGYHGKMPVYEVLTAGNEIKHLIVSRATPEQIQAQALRDGMKSFLQDGIAKIFAGQTDWHQVKKACA